MISVPKSEIFCSIQDCTASNDVKLTDAPLSKVLQNCVSDATMDANKCPNGEIIQQNDDFPVENTTVKVRANLQQKPLTRKHDFDYFST